MNEIVTIAEHHFRAVIDKNIDAILNRYANSENTYVFVEGPRWETKGYDNIATGWRAFVDAPLSVVACEYVEPPHYQVSGAMAWVGGLVELTVKVRAETKRVRFRGTYIFQREADGEWRITHEHFSHPAADPYGIGDWLKPNSPL
jgi:ketosteroid isomerase-like protein